MTHLHRRFTDDQVSVLLHGYCQGLLERGEIQEILDIGRTRFFALLKEYRQGPEAFSIGYERHTPGRLSAAVESEIERELLREEVIVEDKRLPISGYNYSALRDRLKKKGIEVSDHVRAYGIPLRYYVDSLRVFRFIHGRDSVGRKHVLQTDDVDTSLFRRFSLPKPYTSPKDVFCLRESRTVNGYRRISLFNHTIEVPKVELYEEVEVHLVPDTAKQVMEVRIWWQTKMVHSVTLPLEGFRVHL
jgi:hypothetical protein